MANKNFSIACLIVLSTKCCIAPAFAQTSAGNAQPANAQPANAEIGANQLKFPKQILRTGIDLNSSGISPNTIQLSDGIQLTPVLERIQSLRVRLKADKNSAPDAQTRLELIEARQQAAEVIARTNLEIDFAIAEMTAEQNVYNEILTSFIARRDKVLTRTNASAYITNGVLWAAAEAFTIPTYRNANYAIPSGVLGIAAGVVPSIASMYTLRAVNGKTETSEVQPNMLAKLFNYPVTGDIEYPNSVWRFLNQAPADQPQSKTRRDQLIDRWVADANIPGFTNRNSKGQLDAITATVAQKKGLSIATLTTRQVMLQQLSSEILKMKRFLLELELVLNGEKQFDAAR